MSVPPYVVGCIATITGGALADRSQKRGPYMMFFCVVALAGFIMLISTKNPHVQYAGTFFIVSGIYPNVPMGVAWNGNNIGGATKRAVGIAMHVGFGNLGGVISGFSFRSKDAPRYFSGHGLLIGMVSMSLTLIFVMHMYLKRENARRDENRNQPSQKFNRERPEHEKGDYASFFRYTL